MDLEQFLQQQFLSNTLEKYCWFIGFILFGLIFKKIISKYLSQILYKLLNRDSSINLETFDSLLIKPIGFFILLIFIYFGSLNITFPTDLNFETKDFKLSTIFNKGFAIIVIISISKIALRFVDYFGIVFTKKANMT